MSWWAWVLVAWLVLSLPAGVLVGRVIQTGQGGDLCHGCGHARHAHEHYRPSADCGLCGCPTFVRARPRRTRARLRGAVAARRRAWLPAPRQPPN